jgi:glucosamine-phosphate N-acetyltransferase
MVKEYLLCQICYLEMDITNYASINCTDNHCFHEICIRKLNYKCPMCTDSHNNQIIEKKSLKIKDYNIITIIIMNNLYQITKLDKSDYHKGFLQLLGQLTSVQSIDNPITYEQFCKHFDQMTSDVYVIRDISLNKIVATGTLMIETKFIHNLSSVGHIEDIVVDKEQRGLGLGKSMIDHLVKLSEKSNCYKVILDCGKHNAEFYEKCRFKNKGIEMALYFNK